MEILSVAKKSNISLNFLFKKSELLQWSAGIKHNQEPEINDQGESNG